MSCYAVDTDTHIAQRKRTTYMHKWLAMRNTRHYIYVSRPIVCTVCKMALAFRPAIAFNYVVQLNSWPEPMMMYRFMMA